MTLFTQTSAIVKNHPLGQQLAVELSPQEILQVNGGAVCYNDSYSNQGSSTVVDDCSDKK